MFRCILDVYVAGDKFHILLLHHSDQFSYYSSLIRIIKVKLDTLFCLLNTETYCYSHASVKSSVEGDMHILMANSRCCMA